jgi:hypothetical protein
VQLTAMVCAQGFEREGQKENATMKELGSRFLTTHFFWRKMRRVLFARKRFRNVRRVVIDRGHSSFVVD